MIFSLSDYIDLTFKRIYRVCWHKYYYKKYEEFLKVSFCEVHPYSSIDTTAAWKKLRFILSVRSEAEGTPHKQLPTPTPPMTERFWQTPAQAEIQLHSLERAAAGLGLHANTHKTKYMRFNQASDISILNGSSLKLADKFTYLGSSVSSIKTDINTRLAKVRRTYQTLN